MPECIAPRDMLYHRYRISVGASISPWLSGLRLAAGFIAAPFLLAGGLKIIYDLLLYRNFRRMKTPEEVDLANT